MEGRPERNRVVRNPAPKCAAHSDVDVSTYDTVVSCLKCAIEEDGNKSLLEPLYLCKEAAEITPESPNGSLETLIQMRLEAIYSSRRTGWNYYTSLLWAARSHHGPRSPRESHPSRHRMQMYAVSLIYAQDNPKATLYDLYRAKKAPDQQKPTYTVESNARFYDMFQKAISDRIVQTPSAGARLLRKALRAKMTSIRKFSCTRSCCAGNLDRPLPHRLGPQKDTSTSRSRHSWQCRNHRPTLR